MSQLTLSTTLLARSTSQMSKLKGSRSNSKLNTCESTNESFQAKRSQACDLNRTRTCNRVSYLALILLLLWNLGVSVCTELIEFGATLATEVYGEQAAPALGEFKFFRILQRN